MAVGFDDKSSIFHQRKTCYNAGVVRIRKKDCVAPSDYTCRIPIPLRTNQKYLANMLKSAETT